MIPQLLIHFFEVVINVATIQKPIDLVDKYMLGTIWKADSFNYEPISSVKSKFNIAPVETIWNFIVVIHSVTLAVIVTFKCQIRSLNFIDLFDLVWFQWFNVTLFFRIWLVQCLALNLVSFCKNFTEIFMENVWL